ncbi:hypothetical protein PINS_up000866 [Pythium insidiosum]|nr:hypothetical protein PINS_up000866 [Pythium insidiosum]
MEMEERVSLDAWRSVVTRRLQNRRPRSKGFTIDKSRRVLWIDWHTTGHRHLDDPVRAGEYVELLDLLLRVDRAAGLQELALLLGDAGARFLRRVDESEDDTEPPPFTIGVSVEVARRDVVHDVPWDFTPEWTTAASHRQFYTTRLQLLRAYKARHGVAFDRTVNGIPLRVAISDAEHEDNPDEVTPLAEVLHGALTASVHTALVQRPPSSLVVRDVGTRLFQTRVTTSDLMTLARLADHGVSLSEVVLSWIERDEDEEGDVEMLRSLLCQLVSPTNDVRVQQLHVNTRMPLQDIRAISSALVDCQSVRHVSCYFALDYELEVMDVEFPDQHGRLLEWQWLAWALFSPEANHTIERVSIDATALEREHTEAMRQVLTTAYPLSLLTHRPPPSSGRSMLDRVCLARGTQITLASSDGDTVIHWSDDCTELRVIPGGDDASSTIDLLVPGWGVGTVSRHTTTPVSGTEFNGARRGSVVKELKIQSITEDASIILPLLEAVGRQLTYLYLSDSQEPLSAEVLRSVLRSCPSLTRLRLDSITIATLEPLIDHMATASSDITRLSFRDVTVTDMDSVHRFLDALSGAPAHDAPPHVISEKLQDLSIHIVERTIANPTRGPILKTLATSLETNRRLTRCLAYTASRSRFDEFSPAFKALDRQLLPVRRAPLALQSKLVFLSVVQPSLPTDPRSVPSLDSLVISKIFSLAGSCVERHCELVLEM